MDAMSFTLAGREEQVAIFTVNSTKGFLLVRILMGHVVWQETMRNQKGHNHHIVRRN